MKSIKYKLINFLRKIKHRLELQGKILRQVEICITTKCTLRCVDCSNLNTEYYLTASKVKPCSINSNDIIVAAGVMLDSVRSVKTVKILGGEPFVHPELFRIVSFLSAQKKVKRIEIATNGTVVPKNENMSCLRDKKVTVIISDYKDLSVRKAEMEKMFSDNKISYWNYTFAGGMWISPGPVAARNRTVGQQKKVWESCLAKDCKHLFDGVLYGCPRLAHAKTLGLYVPQQDEFVELTSNNSSGLMKKLKKMYSRNYLPFCDYCDGLGKYGSKVEPALQQHTLPESNSGP